VSARGRQGNVFEFARAENANPHDFYPTPAWCTRALLAVLDVRGKTVLEPCAGTGAIAEALRAAGADVSCIEIEPKRAEQSNALCADFLTIEPAARAHDMVITNPPFALAMEFVQRSLLWAPTVAMLLRISWLASLKRAAFLRANTPSLYVLPKRPSFTGKGTDSADYAWFVWGESSPTVRILEVPASAR
jgi:hypothetical protein